MEFACLLTNILLVCISERPAWNLPETDCIQVQRSPRLLLAQRYGRAHARVSSMFNHKLTMFSTELQFAGICCRCSIAAYLDRCVIVESILVKTTPLEITVLIWLMTTTVMLYWQF